MTDLRKEARGRNCQVRLAGICNHNSETTVLAHLNGGGMGKKNPDLFGSWCCSSCHDALDRRTKTEYSRDQLELAHYQGMRRTLDILISEGKVKW